MKKKRNLDGYKQVGKRFIPPLKQIEGIREHSFIDDMLPELIWLGLIHDLEGYHFGVRVLEAAIKASKQFADRDTRGNFALQSTYRDLSEEQHSAILDLWRTQDLLSGIRRALAPLILLYDNFGLAFVGPPESRISEDILLARLKAGVGRHLDRYETPATVLYASLFITRLIAGTIHISAEIDLPDFNTVVTQPGSDEAERAGSFLRASAGAEWAMLTVDPSWARYFWNRGPQLSACERPTFAEKYG